MKDIGIKRICVSVSELEKSLAFFTGEMELTEVCRGRLDEQTVAVLRDMLDHNIHHASELSDLADQLTGEARHQMFHAVESFDPAHGSLSAALELLEKKDQD